MSTFLSRYVATTAPDGLALVQGLLNTRATASGATDLLAELASAQDWVTTGLTEWGELTRSQPARIELTARGLAALRELRAEVRDYVAGGRQAAIGGIRTSIVLTEDGVLRAQPLGSGVEWLRSAAWLAVLQAQQAGTFRRLKLCRNHYCDSAFYDRSKNNSGVWHDVHVCGNAANLRASRARRRTAGSPLA
jgi:predicted RNA-binding Zn ribbon-like protein